MHTLLLLFALGLLIFVHELGHLAFARAVGIRASRVVLGLGPPLWSTRWRGMRLVLGAVPLGGLVELEGENPHRLTVEPAGGYSAQPPWKRLVTLVGGPVLNAVFSFITLFGVYLAGTHVPVPLTVGTVTPGSPAATAQLRPGDRFSALNGQPLAQWSDVVEGLRAGAGTSVKLRVTRSNGQAEDVEVTPSSLPAQLGRIGVTEQYVYRELAPGAALRQAGRHVRTLLRRELAFGAQLLRGATGGFGFGGAGRAVRQVLEVAGDGWDGFFRVVAGLSLGLALFYCLPFPALDGGRVVIGLWETVSRRRLGARLQTLTQTLGLFLLLTLVVWVALADVRRLLALTR